MELRLGLAGVGLAFSGNIWLALPLAVPLGLGGAGFITSMNAITQQECPPDMRGRILALTAVAFLGSYPIGGPITGLIGDYVGRIYEEGKNRPLYIVKQAKNIDRP